MTTQIQELLQKNWVPYVFPFALFLLFTGPVQFFPDLTPVLYIAKTIIVGALLWYWRRHYISDFTQRLSINEWGLAIFCGLLALIIWIVPEGYLFQLDQKSCFNPFALGWSTASTTGMIAIRLLGAAVVVPIMEELFWRSFFMRYLIDSDFKSIPMGKFTWYSFIGVAFLFGLEHHRIVVGIIVGLLYGLLLIRQKKLLGVIIAHAVTNLGLGIYVIMTKSWIFW
jgi:hypothetical protein